MKGIKMTDNDLSKYVKDHDRLESASLHEALTLLSRVRTELVTGEMREYLIDLHEQITRMRKSLDLLNRADTLGLDMAYLNRQEALHDFIPYLESYIDRTESKLYIVGSSLKGAIETIPEFRIILRKAIPKESKKKELNILLTHPWYSRFRENQEDRSSGDIADEIFHSIRLLSELGATEEQVRLYKGTPTCFLIATDKRILVNPYPYEKEAYESFCLTANNVNRPGSIYHQYITHHFLEPWSNRRGNALRYQYYRMQGPNPEERLDDGPDFFVIQDAKEFYLAVFLRGSPSLPITVERKDPSDKETIANAARTFIPLGNDFRVKLLRINENGGEAVWEDFQGQHYFNTERRRGKVIGIHPGDFKEYAMVGIFSAEPKVYKNPHIHKKEWAIPQLQGESLPLFWQWVRDEQN
ncbi:MAG: hypothetical protein CL608_05670 [Anaerolineaceae bacterium]|nr:hypothetical protein [Anaerolineaceae bacterium]